jgi:Lamin Tail Domain/CHU_C Type IX secretion signal domain
LPVPKTHIFKTRFYLFHIPYQELVLIRAISDKTINAMKIPHFIFLFFWATQGFGQTVPPYGLLISEMMPDPSPTIGLPNTEYIELYNRTANTINLDGFRIVNGTVSTVLPPFQLRPDRYVTIYTRKAGIDFGNIGDTIAVTKLVALSNPNDSITLVSPAGVVLDAVAYDLSFYQSSKKAEGGWSLERVNLRAPCLLGAANFAASVDLRGGTPSRANSLSRPTDSIDRSAVQLLSAFPKDDKTLVLRFDKSLERNAAASVANFALAGVATPPRITTAKVSEPYFSTVTLTLATALLARTTYQVLVKNTLTDCQNIRARGDTFALQLPERAAVGDVVVNEILFDPNTGGSRFVELYNRSDKAIDVANLKIADASKGDVKPITSNYLLMPRQYLALADLPDEVQRTYKAASFQRFFLKNKLPTWDSRYGNVTLYSLNNSRTDTLDRFDYQRDWHSPLLAVLEGVSLERVAFSAPSSVADSWHSAAAPYFASPAQPNTQQQRNDAIVFQDSIFRLENAVCSPDGDGFEDFLLLRYRAESGGKSATIRIFDREGQLIRSLRQNELLATEGIIQWDGTTDEGKRAHIGLYLLLIDLLDAANNTIRQLRWAVTVAGR